MRHARRVAVLAVAALALLVPAGTAMAEPAAGYGEFADCPDRSVLPSATGCVALEVNGGHLKLGSKNTPITDPIRLVQTVAPPNSAAVGEFDGGRQIVPGGIVGITGLEWLHWLFPFNLLQLYAEAELAGTPGPVLAQPAVLPLKVKLEASILTNTCYIGSNANPITLNLTTGATNPPPPNTPIVGTSGVPSLDPNVPGILRISNARYVDNAFAVPAASGCGLLGIGVVDALVNLQAGLPSAAGNNEAIQEADAAIATMEDIYPPDGLD